MSVEVLVVGAGPAGSTVAERLARQGHEVRLIEEHDRVGHPVQCAGLVSSRVLDLAGSRSFVLGPVRGATVYGPGRASVSFRAPSDKAFVIDRARLDEALADRAARSGATVECGTKFDRRESVGPEGAVVRLDGAVGRSRTVSARLVIGADGVASAVARAFRLRRPVEILPAFEAEFPRVEIDEEEVEVYLGRRIAPGLFGWAIPDRAGGARIGVAVDADGTTARAYFERLLDRIGELHGHRPSGAMSYIVSGIPIGLLPSCTTEGAMLVGDAAAQVKPISGGGIFTGMRCAELAAETAHRALKRGDLGTSSLSPYESAWRSEIGEEIEKALRLRRLFVRLGDDDLESVVQALARAELTETIVAFGDIDFPTGLAGRLLRQSPSLVRLLPKALSALLGSEAGRAAPDLEPGPRRTAA